MTMDKILITICARGGSKGIPGKNIKPVGGRPLLAFTADAAKGFARLHGADIALSTDSDAIRAVGAQEGLPTDYVRPDYLANDTVGKVEAIKDVVEYMENRRGNRYDFVIDLDVTSPLRTLADIEGALALLKGDEHALDVFSVNPCARNPYFCMVEKKDNGYYKEVAQGCFDSRQSCPKVYDMNGSIYVYRREALDREHPRAVTERSLVYVMNHICFDLDEPADYDYMAFLIESGRVKFEDGVGAVFC